MPESETLTAPALPTFDESEIRVLEAEATVLLARMEFARQAGVTFRGMRDLYLVLGYDRDVTTTQYRERYERGGIAGTIVDVMPDATWRGGLELIEDEDVEADTAFEAAWRDLDQRLDIQPRLLRADKLARLSTYSVILIGTSLSPDLSEELPRGKPENLIYLQPYLGGGGPTVGNTRNRTQATDTDATIESYDRDASSPRFGQPLTYRLKRVDIASPDSMKPVHWSRIVHIAEGVLYDDVFGKPALERTWNLIDDLEKVTGGGAEAFWLRANQGMHVDIDKDLNLLPDQFNDVVAKLKAQSELYKHQQTRWLQTRGTNVTPLGSDVANFANPADAVLKQIAGATRIPMRILTGSEMGELASSQDRENFKDQVNGRQEQHAGPNIVRRLVDRLVTYGYLPTPAKGPRAYRVKFAHIQTLTEQERADGAAKWAEVNKAAGMTVFTDAEIRDHWYDMAPGDQTDEEKNTEPWRAELALKMATANKTQGAVVFTDDEIRKTCYGWKPLTAEQKVPITAPERVSADAPTPEVDAEGKPIAPAPVAGAKPAPGKNPFMKAAEDVLTAPEDAELLRVLEEAIEAGNADVVLQIVGLGDAPGHEFHGNQWKAGSMTPELALHHLTNGHPQDADFNLKLFVSNLHGDGELAQHTPATLKATYRAFQAEREASKSGKHGSNTD